MFGKTKPPNSVCFRLINQRNYNASMITQQQKQRIYGEEEERVDLNENPRNLFLKFVQVVGQATTSVLKAAASSSSKGSSSSSSSSSVSSSSKVVVVFDEERDEYPNLFLKIVKVIGIATSGLSLVYEPKPALNLATVGGDHNPFNLWFERGFGMMRKLRKTMFKLAVGITFMTSGLLIMSYLDDDLDFDASLDSDNDDDDDSE